MAGIVYAKKACVVSWAGGRTVLEKDQVWDADAKLVAARPDLFAPEPETVHGRRPPQPTAPVETAEQAPGAKRTTRARPRRPRES